MRRTIPLEAAAELLCERSAVPPLLFQQTPEQGRRALEEAQNAPVYKHPARIDQKHVDTGAWGTIPVYFIQPQQEQAAGVIFYIHGGGWVLGSFHTHEKLVRELCARTGCLVVFPEYTRSPEAKYPAAIGQCRAVLAGLRELTEEYCPPDCLSTLTVAGDSVGGNMAIAMVLMAGEPPAPPIHKLLLYYPVTCACFNTPSYRQFSAGYYLYRAGMQWFWQQYVVRPEDRNQITASPLLAGPEHLRRLPQTMIVTGQADVLCSEGVAFGEKLRCAGVQVTALQLQGIVHDFVMLHALDRTNACRTAMDASTAWLRHKNENG